MRAMGGQTGVDRYENYNLPKASVWYTLCAKYMVEITEKEFGVRFYRLPIAVILLASLPHSLIPFLG